MAEKHAVFRSDLMSGTDVAADLVSLRVYSGADTVDVDNCTIVELEGYETGEREIRKAKLATASSKLNVCAIVATPEVMYDERMKNLDEFYNKAGTICRGYIPRGRNMFSVTKEAFVNATAPTTVGTALSLGANGKIATSGSGTALGTLRAIEQTSRYTYYVIEIVSGGDE